MNITHEMGHLDPLDKLSKQAAKDGVPPKALFGVMSFARDGRSIALRQIAGAEVPQDDPIAYAKKVIADEALKILEKHQ